MDWIGTVFAFGLDVQGGGAAVGESGVDAMQDDHGVVNS
jgi:hypothetical protein